MTDFGLSFYLAAGPHDARRYVLDVVAHPDGRVEVLWTEDEDLAHRFDDRATDESVRSTIIAARVAAGHPPAVALIPEA